MKKLFLLLFVIAILSGCEKTAPVICTTCTEQQTQTQSQYCGTQPEVSYFEQTLKTQGSNLGQTWYCSRH